MAPIYESDLAEERWNKSEWNHYELWEKVEVRLRRHKRLWILGTVLVFLGLSSVPIVMEQKPRWISLAATRRLGQEVNRIKREAALDRMAYRIVFAGDGSLVYRVEKSATCSASGPGETVRSGSLVADRNLAGFRLLSRSLGMEVGVPGLVEGFCYDSLAGSDAASRGEQAVAFGIAPARDLEEGRKDRFAILLLAGPSAEVAFE